MKPALLVDVTQYASWPARSGVQRVLGHLCGRWPDTRTEAHFGVLERGTYHTGPLQVLGRLVSSSFAQGDGPRFSSPAEGQAREALRAASEQSIRVRDVAKAFDGYLLPEPSLCAESLDVAEGLLRASPAKVFLLYFDSLPLTRPDLYPPGADGSLRVTRYHLLASRASNVAFISDAARREFELRLARGPVANAVVARPGVDRAAAEKRATNGSSRFVMVATIEPRKGYGIALDAFEDLWARGQRYELVVLGAPGWEASELVERLVRHVRAGRVIWHEGASDPEIARELARASGLLFLSEAEGYGLPPLEALAAGCPVVAAATLPSLEGLPAEGQIRLPDVTAAALRSAVERLAAPEENARLRAAISQLALPTWDEFVGVLEGWVADRLSSDIAVAGT